MTKAGRGDAVPPFPPLLRVTISGPGPRSGPAASGGMRAAGRVRRGPRAVIFSAPQAGRNRVAKASTARPPPIPISPSAPARAEAPDAAQEFDAAPAPSRDSAPPRGL